MARRGAVGDDWTHSCAVESVCAEKGACPTRSFYWAADLDFRREFHRIVEGDAGARAARRSRRCPARPARACRSARPHGGFQVTT